MKCFYVVNETFLEILFPLPLEVIHPFGAVILVNISTIFVNAFRVVSPASCDIIVVEGGGCNTATISDAACFK